MIYKNVIDTAEYEYYILPNGIRALIISEPTLDVCSCGVSVKVGSFDDPTSRPGLSHFLEHMLFMGTKRYPGENEFSEFMNQHNGNSNAVTLPEATIYYFDIMPEAFEKGIDMFADFFKNPLFLRSSVERELSAVNSEFLSGLNRDSWRNYRMLGVFSKKSSPASKFCVGNDKFLRKEGIWQEVQEFWRSKYSSEIMCVVIYGNESSRKLKEYLEMFYDVPKLRSKEELKFNELHEIKEDLKTVHLVQPDCLNLKPEVNWDDGYTVFNEEYLNRWIRISPIVDKKTLIVSVTVPPEYSLFRNNPYLYVSNIFLSKNEDGFIYNLKNSGLAFSADFEISNSTKYSVVNITISLSKKGSKTPRAVLEYLVSYLHTIRIDIEEYRTLRMVSKCLFEYNEKLWPLEQVELLAEKMQFYPIENILDSEYMFEEFISSQIKNFVLRLADFKQWLVFYTTKDYEFDQQEDIYGIKYNVGDKIFNEVRSENEFPEEKDFLLEYERDRDFISVDSIKLLTNEECNVVSNTFREDVFENGKISYLFDDSYKVPKSFIGYLFRLDDVTEKFVSLMFVIKNAEDVFFKRYDDLLYRMQVSIVTCVKHSGVEIKVEGFSYGISRVSQLFFDVLFDIIDLSRHEIIIEEIADELLTEKNMQPYILLKDGLRSLKVPGHLSPSQKIENLGHISLEFRMPKAFFIEIFAVGNLTYETVEGLFKFISSKQDRVITPKKAYLLERAKSFSINTMDVGNNACGLYYYSGKYHTYKDVALTHVIVQSCQEMFFDHLRTKEELGYVVFAGVEHLDDLQYICFVVQSERDSDFLETRIRSFVDGLGKHFECMDDADFVSFKKSVISSYQEKDKNFGSYSNSLWAKYLKGVIDTNYKDRVIDAIDAISRKDIAKSGMLCSPYVVKASAH